MVAIVSGNGTGLLNSSASVLGQGIFGNAATGNAKENVFINAANGNLTLQDKDDYLAAAGISLALTRTYNSQGSFNDGAGAQWKLGVRKQLSGLPPVPGSAGSFLTRTDGDGSIQRYTWDAARNAYTSTDGGGAYQTIVAKSDGTWEWHAGHVDEKGLMEVYDSTGRLSKVADEMGVRLTYTYNAATGKLEKITDASADTTTFKFDAAGNLKEIVTTLPDKTEFSRVAYDYDAQNRLKSVTTDLTPTVKTDAVTYVTSYTYLGATSYIQNVTQSDGTSLTFGYESATGGRITSVTDALNRTTRFDYTVPGQTTVTDPQKYATVYQYNSAGQLTKVTDPAGQSAGFTYDALGNVKTATDARGQTTTYEYDANGNCTLQRDSTGNVVKRAYNLANNTLTSQSTYKEAGGAATAALTTYFVYDDKNRLRFTVSPEGRVTESRYNPLGQRASTIAYTGKQCNLGTYNEATLKAWLTGYGDLTRATRTDYAYDVRGLVKTATSYAVLAANGEGTPNAAGNSVVQYTYDQAGQLLTSIDGNNNQTTYTYDGLGRVLSTRDAKANVTLTTYDDANNTIKVTLAGGLARTSTFDKAGQLLAVTEAPKDAAAGAGALGRTSYTYDASGRLRMVQDPLGVRSFLFYDNAGRKVADIDGDGSVTEYAYNANGQLTRTKRYAANINTGALLVDATGKLLAEKTLEDIRPAAAGTTRSVWNTYDDAGRLVDTIVALDANRAAVTRRFYDEQSRLLKETAFFTDYDAKLLAANDRPAPLSGPATSTSDRTIRYLYDNDGLLAGVIDAEGYLTEHRYNFAGQRIESVRYPTVRTAAQRDAAAMAQARPEDPANAPAQRTRYAYDNQGRQAGVVDNAGYLTETTYDKAGNVTATIRYAIPVTYTATFPANFTLDKIRPSVSPQQAVRYTYTALNQVDTMTGMDGVMTNYAYDGMGRVTTSTASAPGATPTAPATVVSKVLYRYDLQGRVAQALPAAATAELVKAGTTQAAIDKVWADYAEKYTYDANGNRTTVTDALGNRSVYFYDEDGRLRYSVNAAGEVSARTYTAFGQPLTATRHAVRLQAADLAALQGGLLTTAVNTKFTALANSADTVQTWEYDLAGQETVSKDALGLQAGATYNAFGEVILRTSGNSSAVADRAVNPSVRTVYDANGRVIATVDGAGQVTGLAYDADGNIARRITFAIASDKLNRDIAVADIKALLAADAGNPAVRNGAEQRYFYDKRNQLVTTMTAQGNTSGVRNWSVVTQTYDAFGNVETRTAYAKTIPADEPAATTRPAATASDAITVNWHDNANRLVLQASAQGIDAAGLRQWSVVRNTYNAAGQLAVRTAYAAQMTIAQGTLPGKVDMDKLAANDANAVTCYAYDSTGRVSATAVLQGRVAGKLQWAYSSVTYDKAGNVASRTDYANTKPDGSTNPTAAAAATLLSAPPNANAAADRTLRYAYDAAGRNHVTVDGNGTVTSQVFDAKGNVIQQTVHATQYAAAGLLPAGFTPTADALADRGTVYVYDKNNRPVYEINAGGAVTKRDYDGSGRVIGVTRHANLLASGAIAPGATVDDVRAKLASDGNRDRITRYAFDQAGRLRFTIDVAGHVTESSYDALGNMVKSTEYADAYPAAGNASPEAIADTMAKQMAASKSAPRIITYAHDATGRVTSSTNLQLNKPESWTYDALGNRLTYTNVMGQTWNYAYDAGGRLVLETSPPVDVFQSNAAFGVSGGAAQIRTRITYNAFGEVWKRTDGIVVRNNVEDTAQARTTTYEYDAAGRQVKTIYPSAGVYNRAEANPAKTATTGDAARAEKLQAATVVTTYDALGNAITNTDAEGNVSYKAYDRMGQVVYDKDALGFVTGYARDAFGAVTQLTRYNALVAASAAESTSATALKAKLNAKDPLNRTVTTSYDKLGRVTMVREPAANIYDPRSLSANTTPRGGAHYAQ